MKKKISTTLGFLFIGLVLNAQSNSKVKLKISRGFSTTFNSSYKAAPVIEATGYYSLPKAGSNAYFTIGNLGQFVSKRSDASKANVTILGLGLRAFAKTMFYFQGQLGAGFLNQSTGTNTSTTFGIGIGYLFHKKEEYSGLDISVKYNSVLFKGSNLNLIALTIGYQLKL